MKKSTLLILATVLYAASAYPQDTLYVPQEHSTIQQAINSAAAGDIVLVSEGTYLENINFRGKAIIVASHFIIDQDTSHISATIIDGSIPAYRDSGSVVTFNSGEDTTSVLCGFSIIGGSGTMIAVGRTGGGIICYLSTAAIKNNIIRDNSVIDSLSGALGGGIGVYGETGENYVVIHNNVIKNNYCSSAAFGTRGGGLYIWYNAAITNNIIAENSCHFTGVTTETKGGFGGGLYVCGPESSFFSVTIKNNLINGNRVISSSNYGWSGGADLIGVHLDFQNNHIFNNSIASQQYGFGIGARILQCSSKSVAINNRFTSNISGNIQTSNNGGGLLIAITDSLLVKGNSFSENKCHWGAGIRIVESIGLVLENNIIQKNHATNYGGGIYSNLSDYIIQNNIFTDNQASYGGAFYLGALVTEEKLQDGISLECLGYFFRGESTEKSIYPTKRIISTPLIMNNTILYNYASNGGAVRNNNSGNILLNNILWGNIATSGSQISQTGTPLIVHYNNIEGGFLGGQGNINADPLFCDTLFHMPDNSPCKDAGIDSFQVSGSWVFAPEYDIYNIKRHGKNDMGAVEAACSLCIPVELVSFRGCLVEDGVLLEWLTISEVNNFGFEVQRKLLDDFITIGFVKGNGSTTEKNNYKYIDLNCGVGLNIYRLKQVDFNGNYEYSPVIEVETGSALSWFLAQNYPNPFNPSTVIKYGLPSEALVKVVVFNILGQTVVELVNYTQPAGYHEITWNAADYSSGIYFYSIEASQTDGNKNFREVRKMLLLK